MRKSFWYSASFLALTILFWSCNINETRPDTLDVVDLDDTYYDFHLDVVVYSADSSLIDTLFAGKPASKQDLLGLQLPSWAGDNFIVAVYGSQDGTLMAQREYIFSQNRVQRQDVAVRPAGPAPDPNPIVTDPIIDRKPAITAHPEDQEAAVNGSVTFVVKVDGDSLEYRWLKGSQIVAEGSSTFSIENVSHSDAGVYHCLVWNDWGADTSRTAVLRILGAGEPARITVQPSNASSLAGGSSNFTVMASGTAPLSYQWLRDNAPVAGATEPSLTLMNVLVADSDAVFRCAVSNAFGADTSVPALLSVTQSVVAPAIMGQPQDTTVTEGGAFALVVKAEGTSLQYQWFKGTVAISGATQATYRKEQVELADSGIYHCQVSNSTGPVNSQSAKVSIKPLLFNLHVTAQNGTVEITPSGSPYRKNDKVSLNAVPAVGYAFQAWAGSDTGTVNPLLITMNKEKAITATFSRLSYALTLKVEGSGTLEPDPNKTQYSHGESVALVATPATGFELVGFTDDLQGKPATPSILMTGPKTVTANFQRIGTYTVTASANPSKGGMVIKSPDTTAYSFQDKVSLKAIPDSANGWFFVHWSGDATGPARQAEVIVDKSKIVTAVFDRKSYTLLTASGANGKLLSASLTAKHGDTLILPQPQPDEGFRFDKWEVVDSAAHVTLLNATSGSSASAVIVGNAKVQAVFAGDPPAKPALASATAGDEEVVLKWNTVIGAKSYNLYYKAGATAGKTDTKIAGVTTPYTVTGLDNGTAYAFVLTAVNAGGESDPSTARSATPKGDFLAAPTFNQAEGIYDKEVTVTIKVPTGTTVRYTTNGDEPTLTSALYSAPVKLTTTTTLKAKAFRTGYPESEDILARYVINRPPEFGTLPNQTIAEGALLTLKVPVTDPDGVTPVLSNSALPTGATFNTSTGTFTWTPDFNQAGEYNINFTATDGRLTVDKTIAISVTNTNQAPRITTAVASLAQPVEIGRTYSVIVEASDPDGDALTLKLDTKPAGMTATKQTGNKWKLEWNVDRAVAAHRAGASAAVKITVTDPSSAPASLSWDISIISHTWTRVSDGTPSEMVVAALDGKTLYRFEKGSEQMRSSTDSGKTWPITIQASEIPGARGFSDIFLDTKARGNTLHTRLHTSRAFLGTYPGASTPIEGQQLTPRGPTDQSDWRSLFDVDLKSGKRVTVSEVEIRGGCEFPASLQVQHELGGSGEYRAFSEEGNCDSASRMSDVEIVNDKVYLLMADSLLLITASGSRKVAEFSWEDARQIESDKTTGSTIYVNTRNYGLLKATGCSMSSCTLEPFSPKGAPNGFRDILMLSDKMGWLLGTDGKIYFSNDGMASVFLDEIATPSITKLFVAGDGKTVFGYGGGLLYRY